MHSYENRCIYEQNQLGEVICQLRFPEILSINTTIPDLSEGSWTGKYYTDYPVTVTAVPADGYEFVGWSGSVTSNSDTIEAEVVEGGITLEAIFGKIAD